MTVQKYAEEQFRRVDEQHLESVADESGMDSEWMTVRTRRVVHLREIKAVDVTNRFSLFDENGEIGHEPTLAEENQDAEEDQEAENDQNTEEVQQQEDIVHSGADHRTKASPEVLKKEAHSQFVGETPVKQSRKKKRIRGKSQDKENNGKAQDKDNCVKETGEESNTKAKGKPDERFRQEPSISRSTSLPELGGTQMPSDFPCQKSAIGAANALNAGAMAALMMAANALNAAVETNTNSTAKCKEQQKQHRRSTRRAASLAPRPVQWQSKPQRGQRPQTQRSQMQRSGARR